MVSAFEDREGVDECLEGLHAVVPMDYLMFEILLFLVVAVGMQSTQGLTY